MNKHFPIVLTRLMVLLMFIVCPGQSLAEDMPVIEWNMKESVSTPESVLQTGEIADSWEEIISHINDGTVQQRYAIGATKELDLGDLGTVHMQLAGFDLDERADGKGKAATTWIAVELLFETRRMNDDYTNRGDWRDSDLRAWLQDTVLPSIPERIRQRLISVVKTQQSKNAIQTTEDRVWIPDYHEAFGADALYYDLFKNNAKRRVKECCGSTSSWWLRSAYSNYIFRRVGNYGSYTNGSANNSYGVTLGFCL